jgi:hypothetical protein
VITPLPGPRSTTGIVAADKISGIPNEIAKNKVRELSSGICIMCPFNRKR